MQPLISPNTEWTRRRVVLQIRQSAEQGKTLLAGKMKHEDYALWNAARRFFKEPWPVLIRKLGYDYAGNEKWSPERISNEIRKLSSQGQDLLAGGIYRSQKNLTSAA